MNTFSFRFAPRLLPLLLLVAASAWARVPTESDVQKQVLPLFVLNEVSALRMAGFNLDAVDKLAVFDLETLDLSQFGDQGRSEVSFRVFFAATEDVYARILPSREDGVVWLIRVGRSGNRYAEQFKGTVEGKTYPTEDGGATQVFRFAKQPYMGETEWENSAVPTIGLPAARSCWEAQAAATGERLRFFDSPGQIPK